MRQHADAGPPSDATPEPSFAERARTLVRVARTGTLATLSRHHPGFPFASVAPYGVDAAGHPTLLVSTMAMHTQNLLADPHASLLVTQPGWDDDPLAGARVTLLGKVERVADDTRAAVREDYLARHETARNWVDFDDFAFYRLHAGAVYFVAGFGAMGWVDAAEYRAAAADPLAEVAGGILSHMNADHADALVLYCRAFAGIQATAATMTSVDRLGFRVRATVADGLRGARINFPREVASTNDARVVLIEMLQSARARLKESPVVDGSTNPG